MFKVTLRCGSGMKRWREGGCVEAVPAGLDVYGLYVASHRFANTCFNFMCHHLAHNSVQACLRKIAGRFVTFSISC
jgi:hypothetical protein